MKTALRRFEKESVDLVEDLGTYGCTGLTEAGCHQVFLSFRPWRVGVWLRRRRVEEQNGAHYLAARRVNDVFGIEASSQSGLQVSAKIKRMRWCPILAELEHMQRRVPPRKAALQLQALDTSDL